MPTRARRTVLALLCSMAFVLYLDRVCIGQAATAIQRDLGLSDTRMGFVFAAFTLAYGLFEIPAGRMGDRFGARRILIRIVVWWSLFTALTGASLGFLTLLATRFLFGAGEAGAYPNAARILARWFPARERGRAQALLVLGGLAGAAVAPAFASRLIEAIGWRWTFACFGAAGALWVLAFAARFRDDPARDPAVNALELQEIDAGSALGTEAVGPTPWRAALGHRTLWRLGGITVAVAFTLYFFYSWYPKYLQEACGASSTDAGLWASAVLAASAAGNFLGGFGADWCLRRPSPLAWRRRLGAGSCALGVAAGREPRVRDGPRLGDDRGGGVLLPEPPDSALVGLRDRRQRPPRRRPLRSHEHHGRRGGDVLADLLRLLRRLAGRPRGRRPGPMGSRAPGGRRPAGRRRFLLDGRRSVPPDRPLGDESFGAARTRLSMSDGYRNMNQKPDYGL